MHMKLSLGILKNLDFQFWLRQNDYYSTESFTAKVETGFTHASRAGLIKKYKKNINSNQDLIDLIEKRIKQRNNPNLYLDEDLLIIFDLIQAWGGPTGRNPYIFQNGPRITRKEYYAQTYREAVEMLYKIDKKNYDYERDILPIKEKIEELPQVSESFSTKHLSFWSRFLKNCPDLVIYDTRMREIFRAANKNTYIDTIKYKDFLDALLDLEQFLEIEIYQIERAIFAFSSNYFKNDKFILRNKFKISHADKEIANQLIVKQLNMSLDD